MIELSDTERTLLIEALRNRTTVLLEAWGREQHNETRSEIGKLLSATEQLRTKLLSEPADLGSQAMNEARQVEQGELPSGSVIVKLTGPNSVHTPGMIGEDDS